MGERVRLGYINYLNSEEKCIRLVIGEGGRDSKYFLEVFDKDFQKLRNLTYLNMSLISLLIF